MMENQALSKSDWMRWVVSRYQGPLIRVAYRITRNLEVAREVTQDTFLRLCRHEERLVNGQLAAWLFTVCRNRALDVRKKERRLQPVEEEEFWFRDSSGPRPDQAASRRDQAALVESVMNSLSHRDCEVVRFKFQHGMSYREIAEALGITESNVGFILHNTLRKIRRQILALEEDADRCRNRLAK